MRWKAPAFLALVLAAHPIFVSASTITISMEFAGCTSAMVGFFVPPGDYESAFATTQAGWHTKSGTCTNPTGCVDSHNLAVFVGGITHNFVTWQGDDTPGLSPHYTAYSNPDCN